MGREVERPTKLDADPETRRDEVNNRTSALRTTHIMPKISTGSVCGVPGIINMTKAGMSRQMTARRV
jgi:hypothetical protein